MSIKDFNNKEITANIFAKDLIIEALVPLVKKQWQKNNFITKDMTKEEIEEVQTKVNEWIKAVCDKLNYEDISHFKINCKLVKKSTKPKKKVKTKTPAKPKKKVEKKKSKPVPKKPSKAKTKKKGTK